MITIESYCGHLRDCIRGLVMRVIAGDLRPCLASDAEVVCIVIPCPECRRIAFSIREEALESESESESESPFLRVRS